MEFADELVASATTLLCILTVFEGGLWICEKAYSRHRRKRRKRTRRLAIRIKTAHLYLVALLVGIALTLLVTPYARSQRENPNAVGGEILMPALTLGAVLIYRSVKKDREAAERAASDPDGKAE